MAVWLKCGADSVAFDDDVIPRDALQRLLSLDALETHAGEQRESMRQASESAATAVADKARSDAAAVTRLGYAQGRRDALRQWHAEASSQRAAAAARHAELRGRLADMVAQATARLVRGPVLAQYLHEALQALDGLAELESLLTLTVHPEDSATALAAVDALRHRWPDGTVVKIIESDTLARGSCVCESAQGYVDASLSVQLATLRQAALGALQGLEMPGLLPPLVTGGSPDPATRAGPSAEQPVPMPAYPTYATDADPDDREDEDPDDDDDDDDDDDFDDEDMFDDESVSEGGQRPRW